MNLNHIKLVLVSALAIVGYLMILAWKDDYSHVDNQQVTSVTTKAEAASVLNAQAVESVEQPNEEVPTIAPQELNVSTSTHPASTVSESEYITIKTPLIDAKIAAKGGDLVYLDLIQYPVSLTNDSPFVILNESTHNLYQIQSGLIGANGTDSKQRPLFVSEQTEYVLQEDAEGESLKVDLLWQSEDKAISITKSYLFSQSSYDIKVTYQIENNSQAAWNANFYGQIKRADFDDPGKTDIGVPLPTFLGAAYWSDEQPYNKIDLSDLKDEPIKLQVQGGWLAMVQHYFMTAWIPNQDEQNYYSSKFKKGNHLLTFVGQNINVPAGASGQYEATLYAGPKIQSELASLLEDKGFDKTVDYGPLFFISKLLFSIMDFFYGLFGNWGIAIIMLTVVVKIVFFYPSAVSYRSMAKLRKLQPRLMQLKLDHGDNKQKFGEEMMKLYQKEKVNPMGGCLPILIQMPVFLALYWCLLESVELRQSPFFAWIEDLSLMDPYFILPILMGGSMYIQQLLNPPPTDPTQAKVMKMLPVIFTVLFLWFPSGLVLYWLTNNILSIIQQYVITKQIEAS